MERIYLYLALAGGTVLACQFLLTLLGLGGDHGDLDDLDGHDAGDAHHVGHDAYSAWFVGVLTFRTVVAAVTFFGLAGMSASTNGVPAAGTLLIALASGVAALYLVAWMMRALYALKHDGTVRIENAIGESATVYVTIPARQSGRGKIQLRLQERTVEIEALTPGPELATGAVVVVVEILNPDTVEVVAAPVAEGVVHA